jgi:putative tryptophan/tyrosine transport system substrate-binding protein
MRRREFITLVCGAAAGAAAVWPLAARAQQPSRVPRIGYLSPGSASSGLVALDEAFRQGLRELGYVEGKNIVIEYRFAEGKFERLAELAAELVQLEVDVIATVVTHASLAAQNATSTIPIVVIGVSDPVGSGLVASLPRPGANITGTASMTGEVVGKTLEVLKEAFSKTARVAVLWNPDNVVFQAQMLRAAEVAARTLGVQLHVFEVRSAEAFDSTFAAITKEGVDALLVLADPMLALHQTRIVEFAERNHLPAIYGIKGYATAGGLMAYAPNMEGQFRRAAAYIDKILKGAKPADLPVEQPTKFELVINLKTAKTLGITFPLPLLGRADEVIE